MWSQIYKPILTPKYVVLEYLPWARISKIVLDRVTPVKCIRYFI